MKVLLVDEEGNKWGSGKDEKGNLIPFNSENIPDSSKISDLIKSGIKLENRCTLFDNTRYVFISNISYSEYSEKYPQTPPEKDNDDE